MRRLAILCVMSLPLFVATPSSSAGSRTTEVTIEQARKMVQERGGKADFVVLDVRTPGEFSASHLPGAVNLDVQASDFETRLGKLDRGKTYLVYCRSGNRSARAVSAMQRMEFRSVYHMSEGMLGWERK